MNTKLKIEDLQPDNSLIEINTDELGQVIGGDDFLQQVVDVVSNAKKISIDIDNIDINIEF